MPAAIASRGSPPRSVAPPSHDRPAGRRASRHRLRQLALAVAGDARDADDLARADLERTSRTRRHAAVAVRPRPVHLEHGVAELALRLLGRATPTSRPTISAASALRRRRAAVDRRDRACRARSTVTRSATAFTSCSLCEMKMTVRPSSAIAPQRREERLAPPAA